MAKVVVPGKGNGSVAVGKASPFTPEMIRELVDELPHPHGAIAAIAFYTGSRIGEVLALRAGDIGPSAITIRQPKTKRTKEVAIVAPLAALLATLPPLPTEGYLFPGRRDGHLTRQAHGLALRRACELLGLEGFSTHSYRRGLAQALYSADVDLAAIAATTGHRSLGSLTEYLDLSQQKGNAALMGVFGCG